MHYQLRVIKQGTLPHAYGLEALSAEDARQKAEQQGYTVLAIRPSQHWLKPWRPQAGVRFPLVLFCQEFRVLFEAGLAVVEVLQTLIEKETQAANRQVLQQLLLAVQEGKTLSQAMMLNPTAFPTLFTATVSAAETTGDLSEALMRYSQYLESVDVLKKKIISATLYPAIVTSFGFAVFVFLLVFVIPKFSKIYQSQVKQVSATTQLILNIGDFSQAYGMWLLAGLAGLVVAIVSMVGSVEMRQRFSAWMWRMPWIGEYIRIYYLSRFYRTFSMLLKSGIPVVHGLGMVDSLLGPRLKTNLLQAKRQISEGKHFSFALEEAGLTTPVAIRLFNVGEKTGTLDQMMERAASFHEEQMARWIDRFTKIFEPTLMAILGLLIGGIVLMMYMPIFELASGVE